MKDETVKLGDRRFRKQISETNECTGCAGQRDRILCDRLPWCGEGGEPIIWKEVKDETEDRD